VDLRDDAATIERLNKTGRKPIDMSEGIELGKKIGAVEYRECSSKYGFGVKELFVSAAWFAMRDQKNHQRKKCAIL
jgi:hypothetical protein